MSDPKITYEGGDPRFYEMLEEIAQLHGRKNTDYAKGGKQGHLGNFYRSQTFKQMYPGFDWSTAFGTAIDYMMKQLDAAMILYATNRKSVTGENIQERLRDVVVYGLIASILYTEEQENETAASVSKATVSALPKAIFDAVQCSFASESK